MNNRIENLKKVINKDKLISWIIIISMCCCAILAIYWTINPRYDSASVGYNISQDDIENREYYNIYDDNSLVLELKLPVDNLFSLGTYVSRDSNSNANGNIVVEVLDEQNNILSSVTYDYANIEEFTFLSIIVNDLNKHKDECIKLKISTNNILDVNALKVYKFNGNNEGIVYYNDYQVDDIGYVINGENKTRLYVWYPLMILAVLFSFSTIHKFRN